MLRRVMCVAAICLSAGGGCSGGNGPEIERGRLIDTYADVLVVAELHRADSISYRHALDSALRVSGCTPGSIERTLSWYAAHPVELDSLLRAVDAELGRRIDAATRPDSTAASSAGS